jgi:hypothetical protein
VDPSAAKQVIPIEWDVAVLDVAEARAILRTRRMPRLDQMLVDMWMMAKEILDRITVALGHKANPGAVVLDK